ncbi:hypothetical protein Ciccas_013214 [Cichlidogyrus casuarinus]|uniref:Uncharacterized protein n=1 Tax=Cichlidogyrus casuarinus TaxID=1844966 RepID=A0ABD2PN05_9PLAT
MLSPDVPSIISAIKESQKFDFVFNLKNANLTNSKQLRCIDYACIFRHIHNKYTSSHVCKESSHDLSHTCNHKESYDNLMQMYSGVMEQRASLEEEIRDMNVRLAKLESDNVKLRHDNSYLQEAVVQIKIKWFVTFQITQHFSVLLHEQYYRELSKYGGEPLPLSSCVDTYSENLDPFELRLDLRESSRRIEPNLIGLAPVMEAEYLSCDDDISVDSVQIASEKTSIHMPSLVLYCQQEPPLSESFTLPELLHNDELIFQTPESCKLQLRPKIKTEVDISKLLNASGPR